MKKKISTRPAPKQTRHPRSHDVLSKLSMVSKIKITLVILIVLLFLFSLFLGIAEVKEITPVSSQVLLKLSQNKQVILSSYKQYMVGDPFVNKINDSDEYVIIYPSLRITYDYNKDEVKSISYITEIIKG